MAEIKPFSGVVYNQSKVDLIDVVTPPYDVISPEEQEAFYEKSPYNVIRVDLNKIKQTDTDTDNRYSRAATKLNQWIKEEILKSGDKQAFYFYEQIFNIKEATYNRRGLISLVRVENFETGKILPHERTLPKAQEDRFNLTKATKANISCIFGLFADKTNQVDGLIENSPMELLAEVEFQGVKNRLSAITDPDSISQIQNALDDYTVYIADGHHRYKVALQYRDYIRSRDPAVAPDAPSEFTLIDLVNAYSEGMVILPTHRLVKLDTDSREVIENLAQLFDMKEFRSISELTQTLKANDGNKVLGLYIDGKNFLLELKDESSLDDIPSGDIDVIRNLDVILLHEVALLNCLGVGLDAPEKGLIKFTVEPEDAVSNVNSGQWSAAFFLNPTKMEQVQAVSEAGQIMPQKSTYFYPKLVTGLVIRKM